MRTITRAAAVSVLALALTPALSGTGSDLEAQAPKHNCSFCHDLHGGGGGALTVIAVVEDLCLSCHGDAGPAQVDRDGTLVDIPKQQNIHNGAKHTVPTSCRDCHIHEGEVADNIFMVPRTINVGGVDKTITFTNNTAQAHFIGTQGVCYACHTDVGTQANGLNGHNGPDVCTFCHTHDGGFQGAGGACTTCHNSPRGNHREVVSEFDRSSHHVQLGGAGADIPEADCLVCHDQNTIVLSDPTDHPREGSDHVVLIDQDGGAAIVYDPGVTDPSVLTPFCLSCHDADGGAGGDLTPFSDNVTRPLVNETAWNASSHKTSTDADCADCHEVHGSQKLHLLTPGSVTPDPTTKVEEEEGFCFSCHSGAGVSTLDIQAQFATPINWVDELAGLNSSTTLNDRHDVQHAAANVSGAKVECVNCHDPHTANASNRLRADPDPTDGIVPAAGARLTGSDYLTEWCLDCHDGSLPPGVTGPTTALVNMLTTHTTDAHGAGTTNSVGLDTNIRPRDQTPVTQISDWSQGDFLPCWACHKAHPDSLALLRALPGLRPDTTGAAYDAYEANNLFQMKNRVTKKDGVTLIPVDPANGGTTNPATSRGYEVTNNLSTQNFATDGYYFCNTCHYNHMNNTNCWRCHRHGQRF